MDLLGLTTFKAVVEEGGVMAASKVLNTVQSNVTSRIRRLEEELGTDLFFRQGRGMTLTPAGRELLTYAYQILRLERQALVAVRQIGSESGEVRIGTMESFAAVRLPQVLFRLRESCPKVSPKIKTDTSYELIQAVLKHELDCAFIGGPLDHAELVTEVVTHEELVLVSSRTAQHAESLIVFREGCAYRERAIRWHREQKQNLEVMEMGTLEGILGCVAYGLGVTLMPRAVVEQSQHHAELVHIELDSELSQIPTLLIRHKDLPFFPGMDVLIDPLPTLLKVA